jgi:hypothetical protein
MITSIGPQLAIVLVSVQSAASFLIYSQIIPSHILFSETVGLFCSKYDNKIWSDV